MTDPNYELRVTVIAVTPSGESIYGDRAWRVAIDTEGAGEYIAVTGGDQPEWRVDPTEWPHLRDAIEQMVAECWEGQ